MEVGMHTRALYAGSFDPMTLGHVDVIKRASKIFDELTVLVTVNLAKESLFSYEEREEMIKEVLGDLPNVSVDRCDGLLADYVNSHGFDVVVRGLRNTADFDQELAMDQLHKHLYDHCETIYIISEDRYGFISSSMAKQVISLGGNGTVLVPEPVLKRMRMKYGLE